MQKRIPTDVDSSIQSPPLQKAPSGPVDRFRALSEAATLARRGDMLALDPGIVARSLEEASGRMKQEFLCALADRLVEILMGERYPAATALALAHANPSLLEAVRTDMPQVVAMANVARSFNGQHLVENAPTPEQIISADIPGITDSAHWQVLREMPVDGSSQPN
jgi:hypothetical protein